MKLNQLEIKTFTNVVNYKLCYVKLTEVWWNDKNRFDFPLERTNATSGISLFMYQIPKGHFPDDGKQEELDYPSLLSAVSRAGGRELKRTPVSPKSLSDEAGS